MGWSTFAWQLRRKNTAIPLWLGDFLDRGRLRAEYRKCGKCCSGCPHGPYWYVVWHQAGTNDVKRRYIGKTLPILLADLVDKWDGRSVIWLRSKEHIDALMRGINPQKATI